MPYEQLYRWRCDGPYCPVEIVKTTSELKDVPPGGDIPVADWIAMTFQDAVRAQPRRHPIDQMMQDDDDEEDDEEQPLAFGQFERRAYIFCTPACASAKLDEMATLVKGATS